MIWILIPTYNEEKALPNLLSQISATLQSRTLNYHIVVVNDGSFDQTANILQKYNNQPLLSVITHKINRGLGETERDGFEYIVEQCDESDIIIRVEGDATHQPKYLLALIDKLSEGFDVVNTSRFQPGGGEIGIAPMRAWISHAACLFMQIVFHVPGVKDYTCGYRAYRARVIKDAVRIFGNSFLQLRGLGFTSTLEIVIKLYLMGCRFAEVPFTLRVDLKESSSKMVANITTMGYLIMAILYHWPWGGWKNGCRGLSKIYPHDPNGAIELYGWQSGERPHRMNRVRF